MTYEVTVEPHASQGWTVEAIDDDGGIEQAIFIGPRAEVRARHYAVSAYGHYVSRDEAASWLASRGPEALQDGAQVS
jgi:hypothetical protein